MSLVVLERPNLLSSLRSSRLFWKWLYLINPSLWHSIVAKSLLLHFEYFTTLNFDFTIIFQKNSLILSQKNLRTHNKTLTLLAVLTHKKSPIHQKTSQHVFTHSLITLFYIIWWNTKYQSNFIDISGDFRGSENFIGNTQV